MKIAIVLLCNQIITGNINVVWTLKFSQAIYVQRFLPATHEEQGKVVFSVVSVILFRGSGGKGVSGP